MTLAAFISSIEAMIQNGDWEGAQQALSENALAAISQDAENGWSKMELESALTKINAALELTSTRRNSIEKLLRALGK
jgi:hypothetical protein